jgi:heat shock protein HslJ
VDDESVDDDASAWIVLDAGSKRVSGSGGCNRVSGTYRIGDGTLRFGPLVSTKMACDDLDVETAFLRALEATRTYRVRGRTLDLFDGAGDRVARLEAQGLR